MAPKLGRGFAAVSRPSFIVAFLSLVLSGVTLYVSWLEEPQLAIYGGCNWQYGRGPGSFDEYFIIPLTIVNSGARGGTVLALDLVVDKGGASGGTAGKSFTGNYIVVGEQTRRLFTPIAVAGHASASSAVVFTPRTRSEPPLIDLAAFAAPARFQAAVTLRAAAPVSKGLAERLFAGSRDSELFQLVLKPDLVPMLLNDKPANFDACAGTLPQPAGAN